MPLGEAASDAVCVCVCVCACVRARARACVWVGGDGGGGVQVEPAVGMQVKMLPGLEDRGTGKITKVYKGQVDVGAPPPAPGPMDGQTVVK